MLILVALIVVSLLLVQRLWLGYPKRAEERLVITAGEAAFLDAAAASFFPTEGSIGLAPEDADLPGYLDRYLAQLPGRQRILIRLLMLLFEQSTLLLPARGVGAFRRFSSMTPEQREQSLRGWAESSLYLRRAAFSALKAVLVMGYVGHPECLRALGLQPYEISTPVLESDLLYPPIGAASDDVRFGPQDVTGPQELPPLGVTGSRN